MSDYTLDYTAEEINEKLAQVGTNKEDIGKLSQDIVDLSNEVDELKENEGGATAEQIQQIEANKQNIEQLTQEVSNALHPLETTGGVVRVTAEADDIITITGSGEVTLVHQGKNFMPSAKNAQSTNGLTFTPQEDGGLKIVGTASKDTSYNIVTGSDPITIPPGVYTFQIRYTGSGNARFFMDYLNGSSWSSLYNSHMMKFAPKTFSFETWTTIRLYSYILAGSVLDDVFYPQLELGETATDFEKYNRKEIETELSCAIRANEGDNVFYTTEWDVITASVWNMREIASALLDATENQKSGIYVTPSMFGAVCDGVTDDSLALQTAIDSGYAVVIDKTLAIHSSVTTSGKITIMNGAKILISANVDGIVTKTGAEIDGTGAIEVAIDGYTKRCIVLDGSKNVNLKDITIIGKNQYNPTGIGIHLVSASANMCYNYVDKITIRNCMYGVYIEATESYWNTSNNVNMQSIFCGNAIRLKGSGHNWIKVCGESGHKTVNNTDIYLEDSYCNYITTTLVDVNEPGHNQYCCIMDAPSNNNVLLGDVLLPQYVQDHGLVNRIFYSGLGNVTYNPIPGIYDIFADPGYLKKFEVFGDGTEFVSTNVFDYPHKTTNQRIEYKNNNFETLDPTEWGCKVTLESTYTGGMFIYSLLVVARSDTRPYKIGCRIYRNGAWSEEKEIGFAGDSERTISMENYFNFDSLQHCTKMQLIFYGSYSLNEGVKKSPSGIITAISATTLLYDYVDTGDPFTGLRKSGDTAHGDITFVKEKSVVLESPNGTKYKIAVADDGTLSAVPVTS